MSISTFYVSNTHSPILFMIRSISLINCQSWDNSTIELATDRVNVLQATNNVGKSVLFKMLKVTANPKCYPLNKLRELIRWGTSGAIILFTFTDGTQGYTQVLPTGVSYFYNGTMYATPPKEYLDKIGLLTSNNMIANLIDARQDLLLVDPSLSANYDLMQLLVHNDELENVRDHVEATLKTHSIKSDTLAMVSRVLQSQLAQYEYTDIEKRERNLEIGQLCYDIVYDTLIPVWKLIESIGTDVKWMDFNKLGNVLNAVTTISEVNFQSIGVPEFNSTLLSFNEVLQQIAQIDFTKLYVPEFKAANKEIYTVLNLISEMNFGSVYSKEYKSFDDVYNVLSVLDSVPFENLAVDDQAKESMNLLQEQLKELNAFYECPIYGQVMYDGQDCKPYTKGDSK